MAVVPLRRMAKGQKGIIHRVTASGEIGRRLLDMGLVPGTPFQVQGRAPLKDPVAIRIRSFTLMLRNSESDFIEAEVEEVS
ncbi:MAG: FeoA family protein [Syntrophobacteraceae bacterium]